MHISGDISTNNADRAILLTSKIHCLCAMNLYVSSEYIPTLKKVVLYLLVTIVNTVHSVLKVNFALAFFM